MSDAVADTSNTEIGLAEAAKLIEGTLDPKPKARATEAASEPHEGEEQHEVEADEGAETPEEGDDPEAEAPEEATDDADDAEEGDDGEEQGTFTVKIDGKDVQVSRDEVLKGYMRQSDYTRKTQALAEERRALTETTEQARSEREAYSVLLPRLAEALQNLTPQEPDWDTLLATNPAEYLKQQHAWNARQRQLEAIASEQARLEHERQKEHASRHEKDVAEGLSYLLEQVPEWRDEKRFAADKARIRDYAVGMGASPEEIAAITNPRIVILLRKAMMFDAMSKSPPRPTVPKSPRPVAPGTEAIAPRPVSDVTRAKQRLAKTGSVDDAAKVIANML